jgi:alkylation response protein AidB-like acyl-CoA dehydrogenase
MEKKFMDFELSKEQQDIIQAAREFALGEFPDRALEFDREETFDYAIWKKACDLGFVGMNISEEYGGAGLGILEVCLVMEEFWAVDAGIGGAILTTSFSADLIDMFGTEAQKKKYLTPLPAGKEITAGAITEPDAGSDVSMVSTTAVKEKDEYIINGTKMFVSNGDVAGYVLVFCQTDPKHSDKHKRHSWIVVESDRKGFEATKLRGKLGIRAHDTAELTFSDVRVPTSNLLGVEGNGFSELRAFFNKTRLPIAAQGVGIARAALEEAVKHTKKRHQFGQPLASFQGIQFKLAEMATKIRAARNLVYEAAWKADHGIMDPALISMAKWFSGEIAVKCADEALQMHGGYGYLDEYKVQRIYRDAKIVEIYEGTKEIEKNIIARKLLS